MYSLKGRLWRQAFLPGNSGKIGENRRNRKIRKLRKNSKVFFSLNTAIDKLQKHEFTRVSGFVSKLQVFVANSFSRYNRKSLLITHFETGKLMGKVLTQDFLRMSAARHCRRCGEWRMAMLRAAIQFFCQAKVCTR